MESKSRKSTKNVCLINFFLVHLLNMYGKESKITLIFLFRILNNEVSNPPNIWKFLLKSAYILLKWFQPCVKRRTVLNCWFSRIAEFLYSGKSIVSLRKREKEKSEKISKNYNNWPAQSENRNYFLWHLKLEWNVHCFESDIELH